VVRAVMLRFAACGIIGLGAALLIAALLLSTYTTSRITKIPLTIDATLVSVGRGKALDSASLSGDHVVVKPDEPLVSQQQITVENPSNADVVTLQVGTSVRTEKQKDSGLLLAMVDLVTLNRKTAMAVSDDTHAGGSIQRPRAFNDENPPTSTPLRHTGLSYRFPFHTERKTYQYFDPIAQKAFEASFDQQDDVNGLATYRFTQNIGYNSEGKLADPVEYPSLLTGREDARITTSAKMWGVPGDPDEQITMTRYYAVQRTMWVDPVTGTIVRQTEHANHYYARDKLKPELTLADYSVTSTDHTVESQINAARDERDRLALWSRVLPITFTAIGLIALIGGAVLASFSLRSESVLNDPGLDRGEYDYYGRGGHGSDEPVPGAEAETEKLPTQRPDLHAEPDPPPSSSGEPSDTGPPGPSDPTVQA
jgi:Porin PorA